MFQRSQHRSVAASIGPACILFCLATFSTPRVAMAELFEQTFKISSDGLLQIESHSGSIFVRGWDKNEIHVRARHRSDIEIQARTRPDRVSLFEGGKEKDNSVDYEIKAPVGTEIQIRGHHTDITVEGIYAPVELQAVDGDVFLLGGRDDVYLKSMQGEVEVEDASGHIELHSLNENITAVDCKGSLLVETVNGNVRLQNVVTDEVDVSTVNGDILYDGELIEGGDYYFSTHDGDVSVRVDPESNLNVTIANFRGTFEPDFPVDLEEKSDAKRIRFQMGRGGTDLHIQSFSGDVRLFDPKRGRRKTHR